VRAAGEEERSGSALAAAAAAAALLRSVVFYLTSVVVVCDAGLGTALLSVSAENSASMLNVEPAKSNLCTLSWMPSRSQVMRLLSFAIFLAYLCRVVGLNGLSPADGVAYGIAYGVACTGLHQTTSLSTYSCVAVVMHPSRMWTNARSKRLFSLSWSSCMSGETCIGSE